MTVAIFRTWVARLKAYVITTSAFTHDEERAASHDFDTVCQVATSSETRMTSAARFLNQITIPFDRILELLNLPASFDFDPVTNITGAANGKRLASTSRV